MKTMEKHFYAIRATSQATREAKSYSHQSIAIRKNVLATSVCVIAVLTLLVSGCAHSGRISKSMQAGFGEGATGPQEGKAMVVFMRPASLGYNIQSSVFEIKDNKPELIGIIAAKTKVAYQADPGQHLFMVIGESADFMNANVLPNKTYYVIVKPRMGAWKARFSIIPEERGKLDTGEFNKLLAVCRWVEKTPASDIWAAKNMNSIVSKQTAYYPGWAAKPENEKPNLLPEDGR